MSHFPVLVLVDREIAREDAADVVTPLLAPYDENDEIFRDGSRWDWWTVGGRWTGAISPVPYASEEDPENFETCFLCNGTGRRVDAEKFEQENPGWIEWTGGCNGCKGKGWEVAWPTKWKAFDGDVQPVAALSFKTYRWEHEGAVKTREFIPTAVVTPDGKWHEQARMGWFGMTIEDEAGDGEKPEHLWRATVQALIEQHPSGYAVLVDCHV